METFNPISHQGVHYFIMGGFNMIIRWQQHNLCGLLGPFQNRVSGRCLKTYWEKYSILILVTSFI